MTIMTLRLVTSNTSISLHETRFQNQLQNSHLACVRGRTSGAFRGYGTFGWTSAVQALTLLFVRAALAGKGATGSENEALLSGGAASAASTLDMAISARTSWLSDMFGCDYHGVPIASRVFPRTNPNRKRPGPVSVGLNPNFIATSAITVTIDGREVTAIDELRRCERALADLWQIGQATEGNCDKQAA